MAQAVTLSYDTLAAEAWSRGIRPEPRLTVSEWADEHRILTSRTSSETGPWRTDRFPFVREVMDSLSASCPIQRIVWMGGRQIAKSEVALNWIGYVIQHAPGPMLVIEPGVEMAKKVSKQRLAPMIEASPTVRERVSEARSRDSGNTMFVKEFDGGILILTGSNSSSALRAMPIRYLLAEEVDEYPDSVEDKGDPLSIAEQCTNNFPNRKIFINGNPGVRHIPGTTGGSRTEREFLRGDQRRYFIPCPSCGGFDYLTWTGFGDHVMKADAGHHRIAWDDGKPETAHMVCSHCGDKIDEHWKTQMLARGEWRATAEGDGVTRSYHLSTLYSPIPFKSWPECAIQFLASKSDVRLLRAFVNEVLGETWDEARDKVGIDEVKSRRAVYAAEVPAGVGVLVASVDVQKDRLEYVVKGYGAGEESWLIEWSAITGDPTQDAVWFKLDQVLKREWTHESGQKLRLERVCVDSGGHHTDQVYRFCYVREGRGVFAVKGGTEKGTPIVGRPSRNNRYRAALYVLCTDTAKLTIMARLKIQDPGPGYMHLPDGIDDEYCEQLVAEEPFYRWAKGRSTREWRKTRERNEALDLEVYALAALYIGGPNLIRSLGERAAKLALKLEGGEKAAEVKPMVPPALLRPRRGGWVTGI